MNRKEEISELNIHLAGLTGRPVSITDLDGSLLAILKPVNGDPDLNIREIASLFSEWREKTKKFFKTGFEPDVNRTEKWLREVVIGNPGKLLYLILVEGRIIGHFGLTHITKSSAELDNAIRGVKGGHPDLFRYAEYVILDLAFKHLKVDFVYGNLFSNNFLAMTLHKQFGFSEKYRKPLKLVTNRDGWEYVVCKPEEATERFEFSHIVLTEENFNNSAGKKIKYKIL